MLLRAPLAKHQCVLLSYVMTIRGTVLLLTRQQWKRALLLNKMPIDQMTTTSSPTRDASFRWSVKQYCPAAGAQNLHRWWRREFLRRCLGEVC